jgi:hypothetical protein
VNRSYKSSRSIDADSTSADFTFRRNSPKLFSSFESCKCPVMVVVLGAILPLSCRDPMPVNFLGQGRLNIPGLWKSFSRLPERLSSLPAPGTHDNTTRFRPFVRRMQNVRCSEKRYSSTRQAEIAERQLKWSVSERTPGP